MTDTEPCRSGHTDCTVDCGWCKGTGRQKVRLRWVPQTQDESSSTAAGATSVPQTQSGNTDHGGSQ